MERFFIIGAGRCGSKMLREMLLSHPRVKILIETHFYPKLYDEIGMGTTNPEHFINIAYHHYNGQKSWLDIIVEREKREIENIKESFLKMCYSKGIRNATIKKYSYILTEIIYNHIPEFLGDKTPHYGVEIPLLRKIWPNAKFIHLVRDGVFSAKSMTKHQAFRRQIFNNIKLQNLDRCLYKNKIQRYPDGVISTKDAIKFWESIVNCIDNNGDKIGNAFMTVKYESLLLDPVNTIKEVMSFIGIDEINPWAYYAALVPRPFALTESWCGIRRSRYKELAGVVPNTMLKYSYPDHRTYPYVREALRSAGFFVRYVSSRVGSKITSR